MPQIYLLSELIERWLAILVNMQMLINIKNNELKFLHRCCILNTNAYICSPKNLKVTNSR